MSTQMVDGFHFLIGFVYSNGWTWSERVDESIGCTAIGATRLAMGASQTQALLGPRFSRFLFAP